MANMDNSNKQDNSSERIDVSVQLTPLLGAALRAWGFDPQIRVMVAREFEQKIPDEEEAMLAAFERGLLENRFELHGNPTSSTAGHVLAHVSDLLLDDSRENLGGEVEGHGSDADRQLWSAATAEQLEELSAEAYSLGELAEKLWTTHCLKHPH